MAPQMVNGIDLVSSDFRTPYGTIVSRWTKSVEGNIIEVEVPVNSKAIMVLPVKEGSEILENGVSIFKSADVKMISQSEGKVTLKFGSGTYKFHTHN